MEKKELQSFIKLVEQKEDIIDGINKAMKDAERDPHRRSGGELFWCVCSPGMNTEYGETIFLVDTQFFMFMSRGIQNVGDIVYYNYRLYSQANKEQARSDAIARWMKHENIINY